METKKYASVDCPEIVVEESDDSFDVLLNFYKGLGWNGLDSLDSRKVKVAEKTWGNLADSMMEANSNEAEEAGLLIVDAGPGVEDGIAEGKVRLYAGWTKPEIANEVE